MKASKTTFGNLLDFWAGLRGKGASRENGLAELPLRSELFSRAQMEQHGKSLASLHRLSLGRAPGRLLTRLAENEGILIGVRDLVEEAVKANRRISPAGEWLLDNFYLIEEQIRTAKRHFPTGYSRELPRLLDGPSAGISMTSAGNSPVASRLFAMDFPSRTPCAASRIASLIL